MPPKLAGGGVNVAAALGAGAAVSGMFYVLRELRADMHEQLEAASVPVEQRRSSALVGPAAPRPELRLLHAQVVFRHGARTPHFDLPPRVAWDEAGVAAKEAAAARLGGLVATRLQDMKRGVIALDSLRRPGGAAAAAKVPPGGELTSLGLEQAVALGRRLRERYWSAGAGNHRATGGGLLALGGGRPPLEQQLLVRATRIARTVETARGVVSGLLLPHHGGAAAGAADVAAGAGGAATAAPAEAPTSSQQAAVLPTVDIHLSRGPEWLVVNTGTCAAAREAMARGFTTTADASAVGATARAALLEARSILAQQGEDDVGGADVARGASPSPSPVQAAVEQRGLVVLHDILASRAAHGKALPDGFAPQLSARIEEGATRQQTLAFLGGADWLAAATGGGAAVAEAKRRALRLCCGRMLHHMCCTMEDAAAAATASAAATPGNGGASPTLPLLAPDEGRFGAVAAPEGGRRCPLVLYSSHDWTLIPLLSVLSPGWGMGEGAAWVPFAADLAFELFEDEGADAADADAADADAAASGGRFLVRVLYCGEPLPLRECGADADGLCTLQRFRAWLRGASSGGGFTVESIADYNAECGNPSRGE
jgi:hypothetical protein